LISSPTTKKKIGISAVFTQPLTLICSMNGRPAPAPCVRQGLS
jgi:hypothetical protein